MNFKLDDKLTKMKELIGHTKFSKFKYRNEVYSIGEKIMVSNGGSDYSVAQIIKVLPLKGISRSSYWPSIQIEWYYRKSDLNKDSSSIVGYNANFISEFEVFKSNHKDTIFIESILGKCQIISFEKYDCLNEINGNIFFCRSKYDPIKVRLIKSQF